MTTSPRPLAAGDPLATIPPGPPAAVPWLPWLATGWLLATALGLRLWGLDRLSFWRDEMDSLVLASGRLDRLLVAFSAPGENAPGWYLALRPWTAATGDSEWAVRWPSVAAGTLLVALGIALGRQLAGWRGGLLAGLLLAISPFLLWYGQEARVYALLAALLGLHALACLVTAQRGGWWPALAGVVALVCLPLHLGAPLFVAGGLVAALILRPGQRRGLLLAHLPVALLLLPALAWQLPLLLTPLPSPYLDVAPADAFGRLALAWLAGVDRRWTWGALALLPIVALLASLRGRLGLAIAGWLLIPLAGWLLIDARFPLFLERYLIGLWLPACLGVALALEQLIAQRRWAWSLVAALVALQAWAVLTPAGYKPDLRAASALLAGGPADILVVAPWWQDTVSYYAPGVRPVPLPLAAAADPEALLPALLLGLDEVWLVRIEETAWDPALAIRGWLQRHGELIEVRSADGVVAERYRLPRSAASHSSTRRARLMIGASIMAPSRATAPIPVAAAAS